MTDEDRVFVSAELTALGFVAELLMAKELSRLTDEAATAAAENMLKVARSGATLPEGAQERDDAFAVALRSTERLATLLGRALARADVMRAEAGPAP